jgi:putative ABC transport system permease protein
MRRRTRMLQDLDQDIRDHIEKETQDNIERGMPAAEARYAALRKFGNVTRVTEDTRDLWSFVWLEQLIQDVRFGLRMLRKAPGFTAIAVCTLAVGIGANTAIFSMVNALLLHPYSFRNLDRMVLVWQDSGSDAALDNRYIAPADAADIAAYTSVFDSMATYRCHNFSLTSTADVQPVNGCGVSANFFDLLGVAPVLGRTFAPAEQQAGLDSVAVVGYGFWQRQLGGDPRAIGKSIQLNGHAYTVVGIMPADFNFPVPIQLWVPLALAPEERANRVLLSIQAIARLKDDVSADQARAALAGFSTRLAAMYPNSNAGRRATLIQLRRELYQYTLPLFSLLQIAAGFVLLLACANLANLLFARMVGRQKQIAMRAALGASRRRLAQHFVSETIVFSLIAGIAAVLVSFWTVKLLRISISPDWTKWVPGWNGIRVDASVLVFTIGLAVIVGAFFGLAALYHAGRIDLNQTLKEGGPGSMTRTRVRLRGALVVVQVMFALVLLVCAGLTIQGFHRLANIYAGFQPETVMKLEPVLPANSYTDTTKIASFYRQLLQQTAALPGVTAAAVVGNPPASNVDSDTASFVIEGLAPPTRGETPSADLQIASPDYFRTLRIGVLSGRAFSDADNAGTPKVALVSRSMAAKIWPHADPLGQHVKLTESGATSSWLTIVGVVDDVRQNWWDSLTRPTIYQPMLQAPERGLALLFRANANPVVYVSSVRAIIRQLDSTVAITGVSSFDHQVNDSIGIVRIMGTLMGVFGALALALSAAGVYGVLAESVAQRTRELGIRVALGASPGDVRRLVLWNAMKLTGIGLAIAVPVSLGVNKVMASLVFGIVSMDFGVVAAFTAVLLLVAVAACYIPARRAMRVDPIIALRHE